MQLRCKIERGRGPGPVAYKSGVEPRSSRTAGFDRLGRRCKTYRLIAERRQDLLEPQQAFAIRLEHEHRFAKASPANSTGILNRAPCLSPDGWKPTVATAS